MKAKQYNVSRRRDREPWRCLLMIRKVWITLSLPLPYPCVCLANELSTASTASFNTDLAGWVPSEPLGTFAFTVLSSWVAAMLTIEKRGLHGNYGFLRLEDEPVACMFMLLLLLHDCVSSSYQLCVDERCWQPRTSDDTPSMMSSFHGSTQNLPRVMFLQGRSGARS